MTILLTALCGLALDLLLGDPAPLMRIHPVVLIGHAVSGAEKLLRSLFPKTDKGELAAGCVLAAGIPALVLGISLLILWLLRMLWPPLAFIMQVVWCWQALAIKDLKAESMNVFRKLTSGTLDEARRAVARIVGRDTAALTAEGVTKATVETVAENFSDGVAAPLFYMLIGGAPLALVYKAVNTMDSMVGYKNDRYLYFGRAAARLDDAANFLPARLAALFLWAAAVVTGQDAKNAFRIWRRDRRNHASPNSAQCESVVAGALRLRLGGPASYFGKMVDKPYIGDNDRPAAADDIPTVCRMMYGASLLCAGTFCLLRLLLIL